MSKKLSPNAAPKNEDPDARLQRLLRNGFVKSLTYKYIDVKEDGKILCTEVDYFADDHICFNCKTSQYRVLRPERTGVMLTCAWCNQTQGPISKELGDKREAYPISVDDAIAILIGRNATKRVIARFQKMKSPSTQLRKRRKRPTTVG